MTPRFFFFLGQKNFELNFSSLVLVPLRMFSAPLSVLSFHKHISPFLRVFRLFVGRPTGT